MRSAAHCNHAENYVGDVRSFLARLEARPQPVFKLDLGLPPLTSRCCARRLAGLRGGRHGVGAYPVRGLSPAVRHGVQ